MTATIIVAQRHVTNLSFDIKTNASKYICSGFVLFNVFDNKTTSRFLSHNKCYYYDDAVVYSQQRIDKTKKTIGNLPIKENYTLLGDEKNVLALGENNFIKFSNDEKTLLKITPFTTDEVRDLNFGEILFHAACFYFL